MIGRNPQTRSYYDPLGSSRYSPETDHIRNEAIRVAGERLAAAKKAGDIQAIDEWTRQLRKLGVAPDADQAAVR